MDSPSDLPPVALSGATSMPLPSAQEEAEGITVAFFENAIPALVEAELIRLYASIFSSLEKFRIDAALDNVSTYVVRDKGAIVTVFLFRRERRQVAVLNEFIKLDEPEANRFARHVFTAYPEVGVIRFGPVRTAIRTLAFPHRRVNCNEDIVLSLPARAEDYLASLGRSTRQNINHYRNRIKRDFPSFAYTVQEGEQIDERQFDDIIRFSRVRIESKDKTHGFGEKEAARLLRLARTTGMLGVASIDGQPCAGAILYRVGDNFFLYVIAHDPRYNDYGMGTLCCYLTICECIARGGKEYHFLWGREEYKYRLMGVQQDFDTLTLYRSPLQLVLHARDVAKAAFKGYKRQASLWLLAPARRNSRLTQAAIKAVRALRRRRRAR
ncbi:MAG TPA: GNAT family N-acetyltransferase [Burkholderiaceae bacterium]|nr:GNAT family N-acetyltransferase [Burkholderiaceae bacterium]